MKPPVREYCSQEGIDNWDKLKVRGKPFNAMIDIRQPGRFGETAEYRDGPVMGQITYGHPELPADTLLFGQIWTGPDITLDGREAVIIRYHTAQRLDGKRFSMCIVCGDATNGRLFKRPGSKPGVAVLARECPAEYVTEWP